MTGSFAIDVGGIRLALFFIWIECISSTRMSFLPFPVVPYKIVHTGDIVLLLSLGFTYELFIRIYQYHAECRTAYERKLSIHVATLKYETAKKQETRST